MATETAWIQQRIKQDQITKYLVSGRDFIPDSEIWQKIEHAAEPNPQTVRGILAKSLEIKTLNPEDLATLIRVKDPELLQEMQEVILQQGNGSSHFRIQASCHFSSTPAFALCVKQS